MCRRTRKRTHSVLVDILVFFSSLLFVNSSQPIHKVIRIVRLNRIAFGADVNYLDSTNRLICNDAYGVPGMVQRSISTKVNWILVHVGRQQRKFMSCRNAYSCAPLFAFDMTNTTTSFIFQFHSIRNRCVFEAYRSTFDYVR